MRTLTALCALALPLAAQPSLRLVIDEDFRSGRANGVRLQDPGEWTGEGWKVTSERTQLRYDLGKHYARGVVEAVLRGPLRIEGEDVKRNVVALWNEEAGADGNRLTQSFFQLRLQGGGMMLRLTNRAGGRSFEGQTAPLSWDSARWYTVRGEWNSAGGVNRLWRDGELLKAGEFNAAFPGFRWVFIGKDNYQRFHSIPGAVYRSLKVWVEE